MVTQDERQRHIKPPHKNDSVVFYTFSQASPIDQSSYYVPFDNAAIHNQNRFRPRFTRPFMYSLWSAWSCGLEMFQVTWVSTRLHS